MIQIISEDYLILLLILKLINTLRYIYKFHVFYYIQ